MTCKLRKFVKMLDLLLLMIEYILNATEQHFKMSLNGDFNISFYCFVVKILDKKRF